MHSSRMRTARSSSRPGGVFTTLPDQTPPDQTPPGPGTPSGLGTPLNQAPLLWTDTHL